MKIKSINTYKLSLLASAALLYLLIADTMHWLTYVMVGIIIAERALVAFILWMVNKMQRDMAKKLMETIAEAQRTGQPITRPFDQGE